MPGQRTMAADVAINLAGLLAPAAAAAISLPILFRALGAERLGVLNLVWAAVGTFTLLDFGLGRSLTRDVAMRRARAEHAAVPTVVGSALILLAGAGLVAAALVAAGASWIASVVDVTPGLRPEVARALLAVSVAIPFMTASAGLRGVLEAYGRFDLSNLARVPLGVLTYLGPVLVLPFTRSVAASALVIAAARVAAGLALLLFVTRTIGAVPIAVRPAGASLRGVVVDGAWMMTSSVAGMALAYADRFVVGAMLPLSALAFYATPQELVGKLTVVPIALSTVLFPALSGASAQDADVSRLFARALTYTYLLVLPAAAVGAAFAPELLHLWLGAQFAARSASVVQWLALAVLLQSLAVMPLILLQAVGESATAAKLQVLQVPLFVAAVWAGVRIGGIEGAAVAWTGRMLVDLAMLVVLSRRRVAGVAGALAGGWRLVAATAIVFAVLTRVPWFAGRLAIAAAGLGAVALLLPRLVSREDAGRLRALVAGWRADASRGR